MGGRGVAFSGTHFLVYYQYVMWINGCLKVVGFQSLVVRYFLLPQIIAGVVCHRMGCKSIKLDSSFLPKWKTKLIKEGLI